jgi:hypothetical protein
VAAERETGQVIGYGGKIEAGRQRVEFVLAQVP